MQYVYLRRRVVEKYAGYIVIGTVIAIGVLAWFGWLD
jgi:hypothetical protein